MTMTYGLSFSFFTVSPKFFRNFTFDCSLTLPFTLNMVLTTKIPKKIPKEKFILCNGLTVFIELKSQSRDIVENEAFH